MVENKNLKKVKMLYVIIFGLILLLGGMFYYFQNRLANIEKNLEVNTTISLNILKRINKIVELNNLDTETYTYKVNPTNWGESLKNETALTLDNLDNYKIDEVIVKQKNDMNADDLSEYTITINILNNATFSDFTNLMYQKISDILVATDNETSKVESFKEGKGYYEIKSFEEAIYNNMYYDYIKTLSDGTTGGPKVKIKVLYLEETNQIKMEINKF